MTGWDDALLAARLLAVDPGLGGIAVRAAAGPVRDAWLDRYRRLAGAVRRLPPGIDDERLLGGLDLAATLAAGRPVLLRGLLAEAAGGSVVVPMAERLDARLAGHLAAALDGGGLALVLLDEGIGNECVAAALLERVAFAVDLDGLRLADLPAEADAAISPATVPDAAVATLCATAAAFGVDSARAALFALRAARAHAGLAGRSVVDDDDLAAAARLVLAPRATRVPAPEAEAPAEAEPDSDAPAEAEPGTGDIDGDTDREDARALDATADIVVAAVRAALPDDVLAALGQGRAVAGQRSGGGARRKAATRGRPLGSRVGMPGGGVRLALVDTLRAAAPWQGLRRAAGATRVVVRRDDFRIRRFAERAEATTIFAVDASGSSALARLAEAKGAVELLLAEAYVRRTQVALVAFRGTGAELVLPPTRSLARAKRCLADLAGGGGTPLAAGLALAQAVARGAAARGRTPFVVVLTDARANITLAGLASREQAAGDALAAARGIAGDRTGAALIDTSPRANPAGAALARAMGARYAPLPQARSASVADVVRALAP